MVVDLTQQGKTRKKHKLLIYLNKIDIKVVDLSQQGK